MTDRASGLEALLPQVEGRPLAMVLLARQLADEGRKPIALDLCRRAVALAGDDPEVCAVAAGIFGESVPRWHFSIVRDTARNDAYEAALRRAVRPGSKVLEIGTGTGLLAMMAVRAGAAEVVTCEAEPAIAAAAREIVARNGYADRVRVIAKCSTALDCDADLGGPADILVSEIFGIDLLCEGVINAVEHATANLLTPDARVIPRAGSVCIALADHAEAERWRMGIVSGFDLTPFNSLAGHPRRLSAGDPRLLLRSPAAHLFAFDFASRSGHPVAHNSMALTADGPVSGIVQWIALDMDGAGGYENRPEPGTSSSWAIVFHPLSAPIQDAAGRRIVVHGFHDRRSVRLWAVPL